MTGLSKVTVAFISGEIEVFEHVVSIDSWDGITKLIYSPDAYTSISDNMIRTYTVTPQEEIPTP